MTDGSEAFHYRVYGLNIASNIFLPELETSAEIPDVRVFFGDTPHEIREARVKRDHCHVAPNRFLFHVAHVGSYYVADGMEIIVKASRSAEPEMVRLCLLGTAFGALLLQRRILPIHGSAVVIDGQAVIITDNSGAGKSTLLAALLNRGARFLADDVAAVTMDETNAPWVQPGYPQQKLWKDSMETIGIHVDGQPSILPGRGKYAIATREKFCPMPVRLAAVCELRAEDRPEVTMTQLAGPETIATLLRHTYRQSLVAGLGLKADHFKRCAAVAKEIDVCRLTRPRGTFSLMEQAQLLENLATELVSGRIGQGGHILARRC